MMISFRVEARKWSHAPQGVQRLSPLERELRDARDVGLQPDEPGVSMARAADASRWQTSSQAYGAFYKLPPREKVKGPQHSLLVALAPAVEPPSRETAPAASALFKHCGGGGRATERGGGAAEEELLLGCISAHAADPAADVR